ncbi:MAG TPA: AAA family ATPase, partial [Flavobacterium sp.]|nr:AAA family ATPase [Flavobacterium sp.]
TSSESISYDDALKVFNDNLNNQIEFITFHQNYSYEDFIQGLRPDTANGSALTFEKKDGVFKRIADRAYGNLNLADKAPEELSKEAQFDEALEEFKDSILDTQDKYQINDAVYIFEIDEEAFRYTGTNWEKHANGIRMKFTDLKEFYRNNVKTRKDIKNLTTISGLANQHATYYLLVYEAILKFLPAQVEQQAKVERKNYVIIIDEINRANISRVFGELITLIEDDKRSHGKIPMRVTLPSGDAFVVPSNLYIIGTMNTADKSIALLDIALRRRFEFIAMYPDDMIVNDEFREIFIAINKAILQRKNHDFTIGHAYFMGEDCKLEKIINNKVIPLLME